MKIRNNPLLNCLITLFLSGLFYNCTKDSSQSEEKPIILAKIDGVIVTLKDFQDKYDMIKAAYDPVSLKINKNLDVLKKSLLRQVITNVILKNEAKRINIDISEAELNSYIENIRKQFSPQEFRQMIIKKNISFSKWKEDQRSYLIIKKLTEKVVINIRQISDKEARDYYKKNLAKFKKQSQVRIRQIVVQNSTVANDILRKIRRGTKFSEMAKQYSLSPDGGNGGDIGWFEKGRKIPEFDIAFDLPVNKVSKIIKSSYGYHLLKVIGKKPATVYSFTKVKEDIHKKLIKNSQDHIYKAWLEKKIAEAKIYQNNKLLNMIK